MGGTTPSVGVLNNDDLNCVGRGYGVNSLDDIASQINGRILIPRKQVRLGPVRDTDQFNLDPPNTEDQGIRSAEVRDNGY